jgi:hypothetical protein
MTIIPNDVGFFGMALGFSLKRFLIIPAGCCWVALMVPIIIVTRS